MLTFKEDTVYLAGRMNKDFLNKLLMQQQESHNSFYDNIYFPGVSVCYTDYDDALSSLISDQDSS